MKNITVFEFGEITKQSFDKDIAEVAFSQLKEFILPHKNEEDEEIESKLGELQSASVCMKYGVKGGKETMFVKNYVGTIALPCGVVIEVLPKVSDEDDLSASRSLVIEMLRVCGIIPYKQFQNANLHEDKLNLFEIYIRLFLNEITALYKRGLRAGYVSVEDNENFLKGKLKFNEHIKRNFAHKEKFFVEYELFNFNRAENRLIKSTLLFLKNRCSAEVNRRDLRRLILMFDEVSQSENIEADFAKCVKDRSTKEYESVMKLCRVFLRKKSFTMYSGDNNVLALMFPMERLYESYIAHEMSKALDFGWSLQAQSTMKYLFDGKHFSLRPDIILKNDDKVRTIVDTKWKRLKSDSSINYGISQADMYQMYAYNTRFDDCENVVLLYPYHEELVNLKPLEYTATVNNKKVSIHIALFDLKKYLDCRDFKACISPNNNWTNLLRLI